MSILSTNHRLISIGESYSAGNGIDITDQVISVTGDATPYSAGENIDIQDHVISGKDWSNDITEASSHAYNETTAWVKENYTNSADMTYISAVVDTKLDASAWSSVSGDFATESYVIMSDNITYDRAKGYVDSQQFAKESACQSAFDYLNTNKLDDISFKSWQNGQYTTDLQTIEGQISNKLDESAFGEVSSTFLTAINIPESAVWQDVSTTVQTNSAQWAEGGTGGDPEVNALVHSNSGDWNTVTDKLDTSSFINIINRFYPASNPAGYITGVSIPESATWNEVSTTVQTNSAQWSEGSSIPVSNSGNLYKVEFDGINLYGYKSSTTISSEPVYSSISSQKSTSTQNTQNPSWNNAAIDNFQWVGFDVISISSNGAQIYPSDYGNDELTALNVYYKADYVYDNNNNPLPPLSGYIGKITLDNLLVSSYIDKPSYFNDIKRCDEFRLWFSGNYYKQDVLNSYICSIGTYVQSEPRTLEGIFVIPQSALPTYEYDSTNKISAINGSALAGGSDIPSGTMNVSGFEYNAVNEISAYNGSAIAQYGAEKQWLQHDDTLVHAANSAQYALGVNVSALQRLMGIDETVLFETTSTSGSPMTDTFNLSGSMADFDRIKILYRPWNDSITPEWFEFDYNKRAANNIMRRSTTFTINPLRFIVCEFNFSADNSFVVSDVRFADSSFSTSVIEKSRGNIWKVIGIGRKS